jgi:hypothetical protein
LTDRVDAAAMTLVAPPPVAKAPLPAEQALALDARYLVSLLGQAERQPRRWTTTAFAREVALVRSHLRPIRTRAALAASFGREAFHIRPPADAGVAMSAVRVAYATRWLELD